MDKIVDYVIAQTNTGNIWFAFMVLAIVYVFKKEPFKIFTHFSEQAKSDIRLSKELLESNTLSKETNELIREKIEQFMFKKLYGIRANKKLRNYLVTFQEKNYPTITWKDLKRAYLHYDFDGKKIVVNLSNWDIFVSYMIKISWITIFIISSIIMLSAILLKVFSEINNLKFFSLTLFAISLFISAVLFNSQSWSYESALKIKKLLKNY